MTTKDKHVWDSYTRTVKPVQKKKPLSPHAHKKALDEGRSVRSMVEKLASLSPSLKAPPAISSGEGRFRLASPTLERKREKSLRQGSVEIEAKLDLHGMTQTEAFTALADFMRKKVKAGKRHLLIITGKGRGGEGVLRSNLENWLHNLPEGKKILAVRPAAPKHGGEGAFYVLMKKG